MESQRPATEQGVRVSGPSKKVGYAAAGLRHRHRASLKPLHQRHRRVRRRRGRIAPRTDPASGLLGVGVAWAMNKQMLQKSVGNLVRLRPKVRMVETGHVTIEADDRWRIV